MARSAQLAMSSPYRLPFFGRPDPVLHRCLQFAGALGLVVLAAAYLAPIRTPQPPTVDEVPERLAKLILEEPPKPAAPPMPLPKPPEIVMETPPAKAPLPKPVANRAAPRRPKAAPVPESRGDAGRERARQEVAQLQDVTGSLDRVLADVGASLRSDDDGKSERRASTRRRRTRGGRNTVQAAVGAADLAAGAAIAGARIDVEAIAGAGLPAPSAERGDGTTASRGEIRTDASLMAVVRRYAPGIQFCYDNELKKTPGMGGKLVVGITVAASGRVTGATLVTDTVGSADLAACALAQIEAWKFPRVEEGTVTFQAPFVFTPPE